MEKIKWTGKKTNAEVICLANKTPTLITNIKRKKKRWIGHILKYDNWLRTVYEERMEGKRQKGRKRILCWMTSKMEKHIS